MKRVAVTGMGMITPIGFNVEEYWESVMQQKVGIGPITKFDATGHKASLAAEVKGFVGKEHIDPKQARRMELFSQYAVVATKEALEQSGLDLEKEDPYRIGTAIGSGIGGLGLLESEHQKLVEKGPNRITPLFIPMMITNMACGNASIYFGLKGKSINVVTACATGTHCIGEAFRTIQHGEAQVMVAGGSESCVTPIGIAGFSGLTALNTTDNPERASIPFDKDRAGFVLGEGAGIVVLEELEHAKARGAKILAELIGYGATSDAYHITSPVEDGEGAAKAMLFAMEDAGISPSEVDYINAHGTSTPYNDLFETRAIKKAFGEAAGNVKVSSTKSMVGHLLGAAGGVEFITCVKSIETGYIHPNVGLRELEDNEEFNLDYVMGQGVHQDVNICLTNSLGFGGHNATLAVKKYC